MLTCMPAMEFHARIWECAWVVCLGNASANPDGVVPIAALSLTSLLVSVSTAGWFISFFRSLLNSIFP